MPSKCVFLCSCPSNYMPFFRQGFFVWIFFWLKLVCVWISNETLFYNYIWFDKRQFRTTQDSFRKAFKTFIELAIESCKVIAAGCWSMAAFIRMHWLYHTLLHFLRQSRLHFLYHFFFFALDAIFGSTVAQYSPPPTHRFRFQPSFLLWGICILSPCLRAVPPSALVFPLHKHAAPVKWKKKSHKW